LTQCKTAGIRKKVIMLEARKICSGATGRNGGHIKVPVYEVYSRNRKRYGKERANAIVTFQLRHLPIFAELAQSKNIEGCQVREVETVDLFMDEIMFSQSKEMVEELRNDTPELAQDVRVWEGDAFRKVSTIRRKL
jgi:glycine/D-amino acid oxidase-like deaminating enzyme